MPLSPGTRLGPYEILSPLGAGGMGEVYRARDTKLSREVALKVLPDAFTSDPERMARFQREAEVLASLNHPNIASIYGLEESGSARALVMELVEGPTLAERIARGPVPLDEALPIARQIAEALEYAHDKGVIHRDLKPANVKITPEEKVKVLDFGLAKAMEDSPSADPRNSPTLSIAATRAGVILGTAGYMSPQQAAGKSVDRRSDIWSFGVVLWEMLTGRRLFDGESVSETLADVLRMEIDFGQLPSETPETIRGLLRRCLDRDAQTRLRDIGEARIAIHKQLTGQASSVTGAPAIARPASALPWIAVAVLALLAAVSLWSWYHATRPVDQPLLRFTEDLGADVVLKDSTSGPTPNVGPVVTISPGGDRLVFAASGSDGVSRLYTRRLDQPKALVLQGTEGASGPFFSPDSRWIGFLVDGQVKKIPVEGGGPVTLANLSDPISATWANDGGIIVGSILAGGLMRVPEAGGAAQPLTNSGPNREALHRWAQDLPQGKGILFTIGKRGDFENGDIVVQRNGETKTIHRGGTFARYLPSGHLVFVSKGTLFAAPFHLDRLEMTGAPVPVLEHVKYASDSGGAQLSISDNGTLVFRPDTTDDLGRIVWWLDANGKAEPLLPKPGRYSEPILSPDGRRLALVNAGGGFPQIAVYDWSRNTTTAITFDQAVHNSPRWSLDGRHLVYGAATGLYWVRADGGSKPVRLIEGQAFPSSFTNGGKRLVYLQGQGMQRTCWAVPLEGDAEQPRAGKPEPCLEPNIPVVWAQVSPDGRWIAYSSFESGQMEVYVRSFPDRGGKWQISKGRGHTPAWSPNGGELFYLGLENRIMAARYSVKGDSFSADTGRPVGEASILTGGNPQQYSPSPDGKRFAAMADMVPGQKPDAHVIVLLNFFDEVRRRIAAGGTR